MKLENQAMMQELQQLQEEKRWLQNNLKERTFGVSFLKQGNSDKKTGFFTGIPNFQTFIWIVSFVQDSIPAFSAVTPGDAVLLVLMKLRLNLQNYDLALRFNISQTTVSEILNRTIPALADKLKCFIHWPEKEEVIRHLPKLFKPKYKNARTIIDCTEIFIDRPGNLTVRASTWSNYKHHNTIKYLVAISPVGAISFLSRAFGGRTSDKVVTQRSGFLDLLEHGDLILADRGFLISEEIAARGCYLAIPAFTKGQTQLSQREVESSRHMSRVRIHVERAIGRLKTFKILSTQMSLSLVPHCDSIVTICSAICNLQPKLVK